MENGEDRGHHEYPDLYVQIRRRLALPTRRIIRDWKEFAHPHCPPDDPRWPAPTNWTDLAFIERLFRRLARQSRLICAITAVEQVIHCWDVSIFNDIQIRYDLVESPHVALINAQRMIEQPISKPQRDRLAMQVRLAQRIMTELAEGIDLREDIVQARSNLSPTWVNLDGVDRYCRIFAASHAAGAAANLIAGTRYETARAVQQSAIAVHCLHYFHDRPINPAQTPSPVVAAFFANWWARCRCRLAFADAASATLE